MKTKPTTNWRSGPALMMACGFVALTTPATAGKPPKDPPPPPEPPPVTFTIVSAGYAGDGDDLQFSAAINDHGAIVGSIEALGDLPSAAFVLEPEDGVYFRDDNGDGANDLIHFLSPPTVPSRAYDINNLGQILGGRELNQVYVATVWDGGEIVFEMPGARIFDINDAGVIAGSYYDTELVFIIVPLDTDLDGRPDTWHADADGDGYNDLLHVVDQGWWVDPVGVFDDLSVIWAAQGNIPPVVVRPDFTDADGDGNPWYADTNGDGINDRRETFVTKGEINSVTGAGYAAGKVGRDAALFDTNTVTCYELNWIDTSTQRPLKGAAAYAEAVNDAGWAIGLASDWKGKVTPVLWMDGVKWNFEELSSFTGIPWLNCINQNGVIVGNNAPRTVIYVAFPSVSP